MVLFSAMVSLKPEKERTRAEFLGAAVHAIFLKLVRERDPKLAESLHREEGLKPFTAAFLPFRSDEPRLRFTTFHPELVQVLEASLGVLEDVNLDGWPCRVAKVMTDTGEDDCAGKGSFDELVQRHMLSKAAPRNRITLQFVSPTSFHTNNKNTPLPVPELVFGSLLDKWNQYSPVTLEPELRRFATECMAISRYRLRTEAVSVAGGKQIGFVGSCTYTALNRDQFWLRGINLLASFAFYGGIGAKTTMGMGQAWRPDHAQTP
jgi:CRISPR-associated endoribonuclease Cas6